MNDYLTYRLGLKNGTVSRPVKEVKPLAKRSEKMKVEMKDYKKIVVEMLTESNRCELSTPVCVQIANGLHHKKRRGANLLNKKYLMRACNPCNTYVEQFPLYAIEKELSVSVHKIDN